MVKRKAQTELVKQLKKALKGRKQKDWQVRPEILLCPNIPMPLHGVAPRVVLGMVWWNKTRQEAYKSTNYHCAACAVYKYEAKGKKWLEGHELYNIDYAAGTMTYQETVPLCNYCHQFIHDGRMRGLMMRGKLNRQKYILVIQHGDRVLQAAGLVRLTHEEREAQISEMLLDGEVAAWKDWRLVVDGKKYKPKFKTESQWREAMK